MSQNATIRGNNELQEYYGTIVHKGLNPGYVVLSFIISYIGSWTTLELINRRTSFRGLSNWSLLGGAAISMGGIGIWCMHFIGNRAITLGNGSATPQISYNSGLTALSFFLPVIVLFMAFVAVGVNEEISLLRLALGGTLAGLGICGMHYLGQASVTNYDCVYLVSYVIGAAIIAIAAATVALGIFFVFRAAWNAAWWKRCICALILAGAVSGMHWLASTGTQYRLKKGAGSTSNNSRNATTISVIVLSIGGCVILLMSTFLAQQQKQLLANKAQQITLAAAVFDLDGRILVNPDGLLPIRKITNSYRETNVDDLFGIAHPDFLWMYRVSRNWAGISNLVPGMREHLHRTGLRNRFGVEPVNRFEDEEGTPVVDYSVKFRELFCAAAAELANDMNHPVEMLGQLFDDIIHTGKATVKAKKDLENGVQDALGKGQILFLVRVVDKAAAQQIQAAGFRFAPKEIVLPLISKILGITGDDFTRQLEIMHRFALDPPNLDPGCHLALFAVRASLINGFDVLVPQDAKNLLPTKQLPFDALESWQVEYLQTVDSQTVTVTMKQLHRASKAVATPVKEKNFAAQVLHTLEALKDEIGDPFFHDAFLIAKPVIVPCRGLTEDSPPGSATLIVFRVMIPIQNRAPGKRLDFTPLALFKMQQHVYNNSPDHDFFARRAYREFAPVLNLSGHSSIAAAAVKQQSVVDAEDTTQSCMVPPGPILSRPSQSRYGFFGRRAARHNANMTEDNSSEKDLMSMHSADQGLGGIMVSQEVSVDVADRPASPWSKAEKKSEAIEMGQLSKESSGGIAIKVSKDEEAPSYVEELFRIAVQTRAIH